MLKGPRDGRARRSARWAVLLALVLACAACRRVPEPDAGARASTSQSVQAPAAPAPGANHQQTDEAQRSASVEPTVLLSLASSAYDASLGIDEEAVYVLTRDAAYRIAPGKPPDKTALDLGYGAALTRHFVLFWSKGAIWRAPKRGGKPTRVATLARQPQYFVSSGDSFAWLDAGEDGRFTVQSLAGSKPRMLYSSAGKIDALTLLGDWVFFVERGADASWRFGRVPVAGGAADFTAAKRGRSPSMLAAWRDIYYYDGNTLEVRLLSPDFQRDETLIKDFICSPIAVWERVYCGQVQGLFELHEKPQAPRRLLENSGKATTAIAVDATRIVWLSDTGPDRLAVNLLPITRAR